MEKIELKISGMSCSHCVMALTKELGRISGIKILNVEIGKAVIETNNPEGKNEEIKKAVEETGFFLE
ncbi:MAG TPA: cation transporter [Ignavibacteriaceae bacterium]|mgnify:CR=1 FL=1|jgi:copper chaperone|nr:cation transporter [Ignavibacteriaceae bacterium]HOJ17125.1 cation transporter [Ignavibacteriaceae bacterium]